MVHLNELRFEQLNMTTSPRYSDKRTDLIQSISFNTEEEMITFQMSQKANPVNTMFYRYLI